MLRSSRALHPGQPTTQTLVPKPLGFVAPNPRWQQPIRPPTGVFAETRASPMVSALYSPIARQAGLQSSWKSTCGCARHAGGEGFAPRGARRGVGMPTVNMAAQTNPKAKMTPKIRYVHSNRISDRFSGASDKNLAEKVDGPAPRACSNAASRPPDGRARAARYAFRLSGALSTFARISSMSTCPWVIQSVRARGPVHGPAPAMTRDPHPLHRDIAETAQLLDELREALPGVPPEAWLAAREQISKLQHHVACLRMLLHADRLPSTVDDRPSPGGPSATGRRRDTERSHGIPPLQRRSAATRRSYARRRVYTRPGVSSLRQAARAEGESEGLLPSLPGAPLAGGAHFPRAGRRAPGDSRGGCRRPEDCDRRPGDRGAALPGGAGEAGGAMRSSSIAGQECS